MAKLTAAKESVPSEPVMPVIPPTETPEVATEEVPTKEVASTETPVVEEKGAEVVEVPSSPEEVPVKEETTTAEETPVQEETATTEEPVKEEVPAVKEEEEYHPWWEGVKEISVFLPGDEIAMLDSKFPATRNFK